MDTPDLDKKPKKEKVIVIFQAGAAYAAYECGAFQSIATEMDKHQEELAVVAGTSSGGLNAAMVAKSYKDQQERTGTAKAEEAAKDLKTFWTTVLPNPVPQLFPPDPGLQFPFSEIMQRSLNLTITMLFGNPPMFTPDPPASLNPFAPYHYSMSAMEKTLKEHFGTYDRCNPRLIVTAVNVQSGRIKTFDSGKKEITPGMLVACGSVPIAQPAKEVDGEYYWDGGTSSTTPLGAVMNTLMSSSCDGQTSAKEPIPMYKVYIIDDHPQQAPLPQHPWGVFERTWDILVGDKSGYDIKLSERLNKHIEMVQFLCQHIDELPKEVKLEVKRAYQEITGKKKWAILHFVHLQRGGLPSDYSAWELDFSLSRINELIDEGKREAQQQLEDRRSVKEEYDTQIKSLLEEIKNLQEVHAT